MKSRGRYEIAVKSAAVPWQNHDGSDSLPHAMSSLQIFVVFVDVLVTVVDDPVVVLVSVAVVLVVAVVDVPVVDVPVVVVSVLDVVDVVELTVLEMVVVDVFVPVVVVVVTVDGSFPQAHG